MKPESKTSIVDAFHGGGEPWEIIEALIRIEDRIWESSIETLVDSPEEKAYFDAYDIVHELANHERFGISLTEGFGDIFGE